MQTHAEPRLPPCEPVEERTEALGKVVEDLRAECRPVRILRSIVKVAEQRRVERDLERLLGHSGASDVRHSSRSWNAPSAPYAEALRERLWLRCFLAENVLCKAWNVRHRVLRPSASDVPPARATAWTHRVSELYNGVAEAHVR
jgi:hypothetical protein